MKRCAVTLAACLGLAHALVAQAADAPPAMPASGTVQAAFAPWDDVEALIDQTLDGAQEQILVQAYLLTSRHVTAALMRAQRRGVDVRVLVDAKQLAKVESSTASDLAAAGIAVWLETAYQNAHNKVIVIDPAAAGATLITGSYNFTWTAQHRNAENILIIRGNPRLAARYAANWQRHRQDATPFKK